MTQQTSGLQRRLKKSLSFIPLPILDLVCGATTRFRRIRSERRSRRRSNGQKVNVKQLDPSDPYSPWFRTGKPPRTYLTDLGSIESIIWRVLSQNGSKQGMGMRKLISKTVQTVSDGTVRIDREYEDRYTWFTYFEIQTRMDNLRRGLFALGVQRNDRVTIYMESSIERKIVMAAIMRFGAIPVLVPPDRRLIATYFMINQLESNVMIASTDTMMRIPFLCQHLSHTRNIVIAQDEVAGVLEELPFDRDNLKNMYDESIEVLTFMELEELGQRSPEAPVFDAHPDDSAFLVFTSGSTGIPKCVVWPYRSVVTGVKNMAAVISRLDLPADPCCLLTPCPLVMETMYTSILLCMGIRVAYTSSTTLMPKALDGNAVHMKDMIYDLELVHPDMILAVPQTLNEIRKVFERSPCIQLKSFLYVNNHSKPKLCGRTSWPPDGDQYVLKYRLFGGKLKALLIGSAHISTETYNFLKRKLGVEHIMQHYACAEACSCILLDTDGQSIGNCGFPLWGTFVRLIDWPDGGYFVTDKPYPRGEIVIGGDCVSDGYYKESSSNAGTFVEEYGKTWCITGDIGEILPDGSVRVIDRKSDLFKLPSGNFVSPARVESELKTCAIVQNAFVYGKPKCDYIVAIIRPNEALIMEMAHLLGKDDSFPFLCYDEEIKLLVLHQIRDHCHSRGLYEYEIPARIRLSSHRWTSEVGFVTDFITGGYKPRRYQIREFFKNDLEMMYD